jgi:hypothetical protein
MNRNCIFHFVPFSDFFDIWERSDDRYITQYTSDTSHQIIVGCLPTLPRARTNKFVLLRRCTSQALRRKNLQLRSQIF